MYSFRVRHVKQMWIITGSYGSTNMDANDKIRYQINGLDMTDQIGSGPNNSKRERAVFSISPNEKDFA